MKTEHYESEARTLLLQSQIDKKQRNILRLRMKTIKMTQAISAKIKVER